MTSGKVARSVRRSSRQHARLGDAVLLAEAMLVVHDLAVVFTRILLKTRDLADMFEA